ncbi:hypothetical protein BC832DRAFT_129964 [Gaertneriomyces semiglobifer]|nr:hypothetical protein BC832DRAFT_129964 [Gaertneriomyces semiglobifer]
MVQWTGALTSGVSRYGSELKILISSILLVATAEGDMRIVMCTSNVADGLVADIEHLGAIRSRTQLAFGDQAQFFDQVGQDGEEVVSSDFGLGLRLDPGFGFGLCDEGLHGAHEFVGGFQCLGILAFFSEAGSFGRLGFDEEIFGDVYQRARRDGGQIRFRVGHFRIGRFRFRRFRVRCLA